MSDTVSVSRQQLEIPTYPLGPDCPYPPFDWDSGYGMYPYPMRLDFSPTPEPHGYVAVILENRYVRATVLPELGGRVYSLYDKVAGEETFLVTPSIKYQAVGVRGAWIAGGIELNFGHHGHTIATATPVAWATRTDDDGGASIWVGRGVRPVGSRWAVRISLKPDRAALDLEIHTMGPRVLGGMMYWWTNAAVEVTEESEFFYFGRYADSLNAAHSWPIVGGKDYRWVRNREVSADMFLMEPERDYIGFYDHTRNHGLVQLADRREAPGQKYFTWGFDQRGRYWDLVFSDSEQTYVEIQRGRRPTQHSAGTIAALAHETWCETWTPLAGSEGFSAAQNDLMLSVAPGDDDSATIRLLAAAPRTNLRLKAFAGDQPLGEWAIDRIEPGKMFTQPVQLASGGACDRVIVSADDGEVLMDWREYVFGEGDWWRANKRDFDEETASADELFAEAQRIRFAHLPSANHRASELLAKTLARDAGHAGALQALAELDMYNGLNDKAAERLREALKQPNCDGAAATLLGWALLRSGQMNESIEQFARAADGANGPALIGLACAHLRAGDDEQAMSAIARLLAAQPTDRWARLVKVIVLRTAGDAPAAIKLIGELLAEDPLWPAAHAEALLLDAPVDLGDPGRRLADDAAAAAQLHLELGLWADAQEILQREEADESFAAAVRLALLAWAQLRAADEAGAAETLVLLGREPCEHANASSSLAISALAQLAEHFPDEPMVQFMLGNVLASRRRLDEARTAWTRAADLGLASPVLYRNLALLADHDEDADAALAHCRRAWELADGEINLFVYYDGLLAARDLQDERQAAHDRLAPTDRDRPLAATCRLLQHLDRERYDEALELMTTRTFARREGDRSLRTFYLEAIIGLATQLIDAGDLTGASEMLGRGLEYPRNMHMGRSSKHPDEAQIHYMLGLVAEIAGDDAAARRHWTAAAEENQADADPSQAYQLLALVALGQEDEAAELAKKFDEFGRGECKPSEWCLWPQGKHMTRFAHSLAVLARGGVDAAREVWREMADNAPDARWWRVHLSMSQALLSRMAREVTGPARPNAESP